MPVFCTPHGITDKILSTKTLPRTCSFVTFGQCKVDAPMVSSMVTLALEKVVATYVAIIIIIIIINNKLPGRRNVSSEILLERNHPILTVAAGCSYC